jgi:DNA-nicking Smr family endonuclease
MTIDLHGHTLASAHALLDQTLARALARDARVVLVIAGRVRAGADRAPVAHGEARPRGVIRAALPDWLAHGPYADRIAATRPAHISHGGGGALYLVLRRS